jgi:hypothetical protein
MAGSPASENPEARDHDLRTLVALYVYRTYKLISVGS